MSIVKIIIYPKEIQMITGKSLRYSQRILQAIRKKLNKGKNHLVTISEFSEFCEFSEEEIKKALNK